MIGSPKELSQLSTPLKTNWVKAWGGRGGGAGAENAAVLFLLQKTVRMYPFQIHSIALSTFASLIGPFGGFFASGFKRAFKIKVRMVKIRDILGRKHAVGAATRGSARAPGEGRGREGCSVTDEMLEQDLGPFFDQKGRDLNIRILPP